MKGHIALVTGASRGLGEAVARRLAKAGAKVVLVSRTRADLERIAKEIGAEYFVCDVTAPSQVENLARMAGPVKILVNNAGVAESAPFLKTDLELWRRAIDTNLTSAFLLCRAFVPGMVQRKYGRIVNVASIAAKRGGRYLSAFSASKQALLGLTVSMAAELADRGLTVNAVCPGYMDTPSMKAAIDRVLKASGRPRKELLAGILATTGQPKLLDPAHVAEVVLALCRAECSHTGAAIDLV
jgi:NAD(P)-dependent dehydrogenase (short-subunit alcohol dehydrogenase family)